jgi:polysaccharide export outer membrane protein
MVASLVLSACTSSSGGSSAGPQASAVSFQTTASTAPAAASSAVAGAPAGAAVSGDYRIGPLDVIDVSVFQVPDLSRTVQVTANGQVTLPLIGAVAAAGKTTGELQDEIAKRYSASYLQSPQVSVFIRDAQSQRVTINGEINKPGVYPTSGPTSLVQIIAMAGGVTELADISGVLILRQEAGKRVAAKFDVASIQAGKAADPVLRGGDTVIVDRSGMKTTFRDLRNALPIFGVFSPLL